MKTTRLFHLSFLLLSFPFMRDSLASDYTRLPLPSGTRIRFGEAVLTGEIAFSPNGVWLAAPSSNGIWLYNARTGRLKARLGTGFFQSVTFAPDSRSLAGGSGREIQLWRVSTGKLQASLSGHGPVRSVAFSPDGRILGSGGGDRRIRLWEVRTGQLKAALDGHTGEIGSLAFSSDGKTLASGGGDYAVRLWDAGTGQEKAVLEGHTGRVESVAFAPDGRTLASGGWDGTVRLWDAGTGQHETTLEAHSGHGLAEWVWSLAFAPDAKTLASGHDHGIRLWDVKTGKVRSTLTPRGHTSWVSSVAFSRDGNTLASGSRSGNGSESGHFSVLLWDLSSRTEVEAAVPGSIGEELTVEFSRAIAGRRRDFAWGAVTDPSGRLELTLFPGGSGFYEARARSADGKVAGRWHSIPLNSGERQFLELAPGGGMPVAGVEQLAAAKAASPGGPAGSELHPNAPNPFNASTLIPYRLAASGPVRLEIYNLLGQPVRTLVDKTQAAGAYKVAWDARDRRGVAVAAGIYLTRLTFPGGERTRRLILLK